VTFKVNLDLFRRPSGVWQCLNRMNLSLSGGQGAVQRGTGGFFFLSFSSPTHVYLSMEAALAEIVVDDLTKDAEDDVDFVNDKGACVVDIYAPCIHVIYLFQRRRTFLSPTSRVPTKNSPKKMPNLEIK